MAFTALIGVDTESSLAYQAFSVLLCLAVIAFLGALVFRARFEIDRQLPRFGSVGEPFQFRVRVRSLNATAQTGLTLLDRLGDSVQELQESLRPWRPSKRGRSFSLASSPKRRPLAFYREHPIPDLPPHGQTDAHVTVTPLRRGALQFAEARIARTDPLGLFRAFVRVDCSQTVLILPRRYLVPQLNLPGQEQYQVGGVAQASAVGQAEEFVSLRDYRRGDPLRNIHWRSWARMGLPIVKEFEDEFFVRHGLVLDTFDDPDDLEPFEEAVSIAASFACTLRTQESLLDLMFVGVRAFRFTAGRGLARTDQVLEILASAQLTPTLSFDLLQTLVLEHAASLTACVLVLLRWDEPRQLLVRRLQQMGVPVRVVVVQSAGDKVSLDPGPMRSAPQCFLALRADRVEEGLASWTS